MTNEPEQNNGAPGVQRYRWPWFVLGAFLLAVVLAVVWMTAEVRRQQRYRNLNTPLFPQVTSGTNVTK